MNAELFSETPGALGATVTINMPDSGNGLSYSGNLTKSDAGGGNFLLVYEIIIDAADVSYSSYTINGTIGMTMNLTVDDTGYAITGSLILTLDGILFLTGGEISTINVSNVIITNGGEQGTITFDGDTYQASDFSF